MNTWERHKKGKRLRMPLPEKIHPMKKRYTRKKKHKDLSEFKTCDEWIYDIKEEL